MLFIVVIMQDVLGSVDRKCKFQQYVILLDSVSQAQKYFARVIISPDAHIHLNVMDGLCVSVNAQVNLESVGVYLASSQCMGKYRNMIEICYKDRAEQCGFSRIRIRSHLYESVLRFESCAVSGRAGVQSSYVLARSGLLAVEIKAETRLGPHQVTQPRQKLR